jgi:lipopolysaccharide export system protein LptA
VSETPSKKLGQYNFRAKLPKYVRIGAVAVLAVTVLVIGIGYYRAKSTSEFRMVGFPTELSKDVVASVNGYERTEYEGETPVYVIKADKATTYSDNHQELENVHLEVYDDTGQSDEITASKAVYVPEESKNFTAYFAGDVNIATRDQLRLNTEQVTYSKASNTVTAEEAVRFQRLNLSGTSFGAIAKIAERRVELNRDVRLTILTGDGETSTVNSGYATYDQKNEKLDFERDVRMELVSGNGADRSNLQAGRMSVLLSTNGQIRALERVELTDAAYLETTRNGKLYKMRSGSASYLRPSERLELGGGVSIESADAVSPFTITAGNAVLERLTGKVTLVGNSQVTRGGDLAKGDSLVAHFRTDNSFEKAEIEGNSYVKQARAEDTTEVSGVKLVAVFAEDGSLRRADTFGQSEIRQTPANQAEGSFSIASANATHSIFRGPGQFESFDSEGRTTIKFDSPDNGSTSSNKQVSADSVKTMFHADGKNIRRAEAAGSAEFLMMPHRASPTNYRTTVNASKFDCDFFATANRLKECFGSGGTRSVRTPTVARDGRGDQTITAERLTAAFGESSGSIEKIDAAGKAKFIELDRNALANTFSFTSSDEVVRLRGGEPTGWDSKARVKAKEIDWDTKNKRSSYRGGVSTTYYKGSGLGRSGPFLDRDKPVYVTSNQSDMDHAAETAQFSGNSRGWQGNNYVRADQISIRQKNSQMTADGNVQSLLYNTKRREPGKESTLPVFASSQHMSYDGESRTVQYERDVDMRQGPERITGGAAILNLNDKNEIVTSNFESNVAISQPNRKAFADNARYTVDDERIILRGRPARVEDTEKGSSQGSELVLMMNDNRVFGVGNSNTNPSGRVRSAYKVKTQ